MFITFYRPQRSCGKVMFWVVSVILFVGVPIWPLPMIHWNAPCRDHHSCTHSGPGASLNLPVQPPTCSDLFNFDLSVQGATLGMFKVVHTVGKRAVRFQLECFLINTCFHSKSENIHKSRIQLFLGELKTEFAIFQKLLHLRYFSTTSNNALALIFCNIRQTFNLNEPGVIDFYVKYFTFAEIKVNFLSFSKTSPN